MKRSRVQKSATGLGSKLISKGDVTSCNATASFSTGPQTTRKTSLRGGWGKPMKLTLPSSRTVEIDLSPRGETVTDLLGKTEASRFAPFGCTFVTLAFPAEMRDAVKASLDEAERLARSIRTRADAAALLTYLWNQPLGGETLRDMRTSIRLALHDAWYPRRFINAKPESGCDGSCEPMCNFCKLQADIAAENRVIQQGY